MVRIKLPQLRAAPTATPCHNLDCRFPGAAAAMTSPADRMAPPTGAQQQREPPLAVKAQKQSKLSPLRWLTGRSPTNYNMLLFRTLNREMQQEGANDDDLAVLLRDKLMPLRVWWVRHGPGGPAQFRKALENKRFGAPGVVNFVDARTKWFDQLVQSALADGIRQVVVVAAGFDTRAYRFAGRHEGARFFEIDLPHASRKKQQLVEELLQPAARYPRPAFIPADLSTISLAQALTSDNGGAGISGFDPALPTLFTVEGLIYYLPEAAVKQLFGSALCLAAPGSRIAFDFLQKDVLEGRQVPLPPAYRVTAASVANKGEPFVSGIDASSDAVSAFMAAAAGAAAGSKAFQLLECLGPREMLARHLPHLQWDESVPPPILSFYSFAAFEVKATTD